MTAMSYVNEASWDRVLRVVVGSVIVYLGWSESLPGLWSAAARVLGLYPLVTGLVGWSPLYTLLGVSSRRRCRR